MEIVNGKHFSITDPQEVSTVIYRINKEDQTVAVNMPKYTIERLLYSEELKGDLKKKTFFIDSPKEEGEQLVFLSFGKEKVVVNMGVLDGDKVRISKKPMPIKFNTLYSEEETEYKEFRYTPNLQRPISIIDPETTEALKPVLYLDKATNEVKGKCKLKPYKSYFAFEVRDMKDD